VTCGLLKYVIRSRCACACAAEGRGNVAILYSVFCNMSSTGGIDQFQGMTTARSFLRKGIELSNTVS
jgi:hypothetical protein